MDNLYFDVDGVLANFHEVKDGWKFAKSYNFIRNLKPFVGNIKLVNHLIEEHSENIYICSLVASEAAKKARLEWLAQYIPNLKEENIILIVGNGKKYEYIKTTTGTLIDDKESNCKQWTKAGFKAIYLEEKGSFIDFNNYYHNTKARA